MITSQTPLFIVIFFVIFLALYLKELSFCHKLQFFNLNITATGCCNRVDILNWDYFIWVCGKNSIPLNMKKEINHRSKIKNHLSRINLFFIFLTFCRLNLGVSIISYNLKLEMKRKYYNFRDTLYLKKCKIFNPLETENGDKVLIKVE